MAISVKSVVLFISCMFCTLGYSKKPPTAYTQVENHIHRIVILSKDTAINGIKEITHRGSFYFSDTDIDSIAPLRVQTIYHAEKVKLNRKVRLVGGVEIRQTNCVFFRPNRYDYKLFYRKA